MSKRTLEDFQEKGNGKGKTNKELKRAEPIGESCTTGGISGANAGSGAVVDVGASASTVLVSVSEQRTKQQKVEQQWLRVPALGEGESRRKPRIGADFQAELPEPSRSIASTIHLSNN